MIDSFLSQEEIAALQFSKLPRTPWWCIRGVSTSQFSVCRHYGGGTIQNARYTYNPVTDELVRDDVLRWIMKRRREAQKQKRQAVKVVREKQERHLFEEPSP